VLKKTAVTGLLITAAAGAIVTTYTPAFAAPTHLITDHTRNWNGSENNGYNHIRLRLHNRNNNVAVARTPRHAPTVILTPAAPVATVVG